jgi:hypothetical protein
LADKSGTPSILRLDSGERLGRPPDASGNGTSVGLEVDGLADRLLSEDIFSGACVSNGDGGGRLDRIRESYFLLKQFTSRELKVLMGLKRNTSPKAWTLREDLTILTLSLSNREIAEVLKERNKEAVKKRLQLLRSKGLSKRITEASAKPEQPANTTPIT